MPIRICDNWFAGSRRSYRPGVWFSPLLPALGGRAGEESPPAPWHRADALYMANCHLSSDWQFKQSAAVALPVVILKAGGIGPGGKGAGSPFRGPSITNSPCTGGIRTHGSNISGSTGGVDRVGSMRLAKIRSAPSPEGPPLLDRTTPARKIRLPGPASSDNVFAYDRCVNVARVKRESQSPARNHFMFLARNS